MAGGPLVAASRPGRGLHGRTDALPGVWCRESRCENTPESAVTSRKGVKTPGEQERTGTAGEETSQQSALTLRDRSEMEREEDPEVLRLGRARARISRRLTQGELAKAAGMAPSSISGYENGRTKVTRKTPTGLPWRPASIPRPWSPCFWDCGRSAGTRRAGPRSGSTPWRPPSRISPTKSERSCGRP